VSVIRLRVSRTLVPDRPIDVPVRVMNVTSQPIILQAGGVISRLVPATTVPATELPLPTITESNIEVLRNIVESVDPGTSEDMRARLLDLLIEYSGVFSFSDRDLGRTSKVRHAIETNNARPVPQALRRQSPAHQTAISEHLQTMLGQRIIEPAQSPWASNLVLVKKTGHSDVAWTTDNSAL